MSGGGRPGVGRASLPMYAAPPGALAAFWRGLSGYMRRLGLAGAPATLDDPDDLAAHWLAPDLLLSQTCGYPLTTALAGRVRYVATPCYDAEGCDGPFYRSFLLTREGEPAATLAEMAGRRVAFNALDSQSGMNALRALVAPLAHGGRFFGEAIETGAHRRSIEAVRSGQADIAAVDAVSFALMARDEPDRVRGLRRLGVTAQAPGLPFVTSLRTSDDDVGRLRDALREACIDPALAGCRAAMLLDGIRVLPEAAYEAIAAMEADAVGLGYPRLA